MMELAKNRVFVVCAALWGAAMVYFVAGIFSGPAVSVDYQALAGLQDIKTELLRAKRSGSPEVKKDIFRSLVFVKPAPTVVVTKPVEVAPPPPEPRVAILARELKFMGYVESDKRSVFLSHGGDVYVARALDKLYGPFIVKDITGAAVVIEDIETHETATVPIGKE